MDIIYEQMMERNEQKIGKRDCMKADPILQKIEDNRRCYAIFSIIEKGEIKIEEERRENLMKHGIMYEIGGDDGMFHFTFLQQIGFDPYKNGYRLTSEQKYKCVECLRQLFEPFLPFTIEYRYLIPVETGIVLGGIIS